MFSTFFLIFLTSLVITITQVNAKRGLGWPWNNDKNPSTFMTNGKISWLYNWETWKPAKYPSSGLEYVCMQRTDSKIADLANGVATSGCKTVLGFNEPDHAEQAHMSPSQAVTLWKQHIQPLKNKGIALGAPAVSSGPSGLPWLATFMSECSGCSIDFIPIHWYGTSITEFKSYVEKVHNIYPSKPIWVTEFACISPASLSEVSAFLEKAMPWLDSQSYVAKYSWFGAMPQNLVNSYVGQNAALMDNNGQLTSLGKLYAS